MGFLKHNLSFPLDAYVSQFVGFTDITQATPIEKDFRALRHAVEKAGLFKADPVFYIAHMSHIILIEVVAYLMVRSYGGNVVTFILVTVLLTISQVSLIIVIRHNRNVIYICNVHLETDNREGLMGLKSPKMLKRVQIKV